MQEYVGALKQLLQTTVAQELLLSPLSCTDEEPPVVLWSGLMLSPGDPGWAFIDPPLRNPNVQPQPSPSPYGCPLVYKSGLVN